MKTNFAVPIIAVDAAVLYFNVVVVAIVVVVVVVVGDMCFSFERSGFKRQPFIRRTLTIGG